MRKHTIDEIIPFLKEREVTEWQVGDQDFEFLMADKSTKTSKVFFKDILNRIKNSKPNRKLKPKFRVVGRFVDSEHGSLPSIPTPHQAVTEKQQRLIEQLDREQARVEEFSQSVSEPFNLAKFNKVKISSFDELRTSEVLDLQRRKSLAIRDCYVAARTRKAKRVSRTDSQKAVKNHMPELEGNIQRKMIDNVRNSAQHRFTKK